MFDSTTTDASGTYVFDQLPQDTSWFVRAFSTEDVTVLCTLSSSGAVTNTIGPLTTRPTHFIPLYSTGMATGTIFDGNDFPAVDVTVTATLCNTAPRRHDRVGSVASGRNAPVGPGAGGGFVVGRA